MIEIKIYRSIPPWKAFSSSSDGLFLLVDCFFFSYDPPFMDVAKERQLLDDEESEQVRAWKTWSLLVSTLTGPDSSNFKAESIDGMSIFDYGTGTIDLSHIASNRLT